MQLRNKLVTEAKEEQPTLRQLIDMLKKMESTLDTTEENTEDEQEKAE